MFDKSKMSQKEEVLGQYPLPDGWRWVRLGEICNVDSNQILPNTSSARQLPYIGLEHVESGTGRIIDIVHDIAGNVIQSITFRFDSRYVLYGKLRPYLNKVVTPDFEGRCTTELLPILPNDSCDRYYLAWLLRRSDTVEVAMRYKTGTRMPRADMQEIFKIQIPLPPLSEQRRISSKIQELIQEVDRARATCEKQLEATNAVPSAYLREVFESEEAKKWERKRLGEVCDIVTGSTPRTDDPSNWNGDILWATPNDLGKLPGLTIEDTERKISKKGFESCSLKLLPIGSILLTTRAPIGHLAVNLDPMCTNQGFKSLIPSAQIHNWFLFFALKYFVPVLQSLGRGQTFTEISKNQVESFKIPLPVVDSQLRIATELKEKMSIVEKAHLIIEKQFEAIRALSQAILKKAFKGEL
jgi:type I restriction enzyme S subunit